MTVFEELASRAIRLGLDAMEVEYKDGYEEVFGLRSGVGVGIARFRSTSREATSLRDELRQISRKTRRLVVEGSEYSVRAHAFDSFGEAAFRIMWRPVRKRSRETLPRGLNIRRRSPLD